MSNPRNRRSSPRSRANQSEQQNLRTQSITRSKHSEVWSTWTDTIYVTDREVEVVELYLGNAIDQLLGLERRPKARGPPK